MYQLKMQRGVAMLQNSLSMRNLFFRHLPKSAEKWLLALACGLSFSVSAMENSHDHHRKAATTANTVKASTQALTLIDGFVRAMPPGQSTTAIFLTLRNDLNTQVDIIDIEANIGHHAMLHKTIVKDDMAKMVHLENVSIAPNATLKLAPGGMHIMIMGVSQSLTLGQQVSVTLHFGDQTQQTLEVPVELK
jgi:periplasmic copper chaperone A